LTPDGDAHLEGRNFGNKHMTKKLAAIIYIHSK